MIRVSLGKMLHRVNHLRKQKGQERITLQVIHEATGIHRKILSRLMNHPSENTSSEHLDKLAQFFFHEMVAQGLDEGDSGELMKRVTTELIEIFPDDLSYWKGLEDIAESDERFNVPLSVLWRQVDSTQSPEERRAWWEKHKQLRAEAVAMAKAKIVEKRSATPPASAAVDPTPSTSTAKTRKK